MNRNNQELITKKDYEILGIKENATPKEIGVAYEKLLQEYHPEKIKLKKLREPDEVELKKYQEIEKVYKKFDFEPPKYICCGWKKNRLCTNEFYPCLWEKVENGSRKLFCSQECYNNNESPLASLIKKCKDEEAEWQKKKIAEAKKSLVDWKLSEIRDIENSLKYAKLSKEDLEPENRNYEQEFNRITIKNEADKEWISKLSDITKRINQDIWNKSKRDWQTCDHCQKSFKNQDENGNSFSYGAVGKDGHYNFCSEECREKGMKGKEFTAVRKNAFAELLKWMEKEGITNIGLDPNSKKIVVEYGENNSKTIEDDNLTSEQKEIKKLFQQIGKNSLSQQEVRAEVKGKDEGDNNNWLKPAIGIGIVALVIILIGVVVYNKNKKKGY